MIEKLEKILAEVDLTIGKRKEIDACLMEFRQMAKELETFKLIATFMVDTATIYDMELNLKHVCPAVMALRGLTVEEAMKETLDQVLTPESLLTVKRLYKEEKLLEASGIADPNRTQILELKEYKKDGSIIDVEITFGYIRDEKQQATGIISVTRDITKRKKLEEELRHVDKMNSLGLLAGGIAHDFNNLLMVILGNASLLSMISELASNNIIKDRLNNINKAAENGSALTRQLLGFARQGSYNICPTNINELIKETLEMFSRTKKEVSIIEEFQENPWLAMADADQMKQVFLNLCINACQAMEGDGKIFILTKNIILTKETASIYSLKPGLYVEILFSDNGKGIDPKIKKRIFEPFFTTKEMGRGTGLGLAMAYGIINTHGGAINVSSELDRGTVFTIHIPASEKQNSLKARKDEVISFGKGTILLVDDEDLVASVGRDMLEFMGYQVVTAGNGAEAIDIFLKNPGKINLVVLDMIMPNMSGEVVFKRLREIDSKVKVIFSSGYSQEGMVQEIAQLGCNGFIQKPYDLKSFSLKVFDILNSQ